MSFFCSPATTPALALASQEKLLAHFLKRSVFEVKATRTHHINYVVIRRKDHPLNFANNPDKHYNSFGSSNVPTVQEVVQKATASAMIKAEVQRGYSIVSTDDIETVLTSSAENNQQHVTITRGGNDDEAKKNPPKKLKTLVLMHGFGLGLGFFYGKTLRNA